MKIAIVYNRESKNVINLFGIPNRERIGQKTIKRISDSLREGGHQVIALEGDKDLIDRLEDYMPRVVKGERPGMVFNLSYGIQGQARYTHVPSILEMVGVPYVGSGPLAHSLALDKVVAKMIFRGRGLPTPDFVVLDSPDFETPDLPFPLIVKPKNEAVSFGIEVVQDEARLREAAKRIFDHFNQPVLAEQFIEGREINVGILGSNPPETFPPAEILFGTDGPQIYRYEDKTGRSGREIRVACPAQLDESTEMQAREIAKGAFMALGCHDCARVDMRLDKEGRLYILEVNSLPSLGEHGSYLQGAAAVGMDFAALVNRLVEVASARYFGTPTPPKIVTSRKNPQEHAFQYLTERRDRLERRVEEWTRLSSHTSDPVGLSEVVRRLDTTMVDIKMKRNTEFTDERSVYCWETARGMEGGTLLLGHLDVPHGREGAVQVFRRDPEWLFGEGVGASRAPLAMLEFALRSLRAQRRLRSLPLGVLYYLDEGRDCRYSGGIIRRAASTAKRVLVLRPSNVGDRVITQRRGQRKYHFTAEGQPRRAGQVTKKPDVLRWVLDRFEAVSRLTSTKDRISVSVASMSTGAFPSLLPHRITATLIITYLDPARADVAEDEVRKMFKSNGHRVEFERVSDRPPMKERRGTKSLYKTLRTIADQWEIPLGSESSLWPSAGGLVPPRVPVLCGLGPAVKDLYQPHEAILRISLMQRALLLAGYLTHEATQKE
jgi:D-alanine-D-alanine ligase